MSQQYRLSLFVFRRDLRLEDNVGLMEALAQSKEVIPVFIVDPRQAGPDNAYRGEHSLQFMLESLEDLDEQLKNNHSQLYLFHGQAHQVIEALIKQERCDAVFMNADYTPFSQQRDHAIEHVCQQYRVRFHAYHDLTLHPPGDILKDDGKPYTVYTPFYNKARTFEVPVVKKNKHNNYTRRTIKGANKNLLQETLPERVDTLAICGGRGVALRVLSQFDRFQQYKEERDFPAKEATTKLSAHHKFGTISQREVFWKAVKILGYSHHMIKELYWREFFTHIGFHFPHVYGQCFYKKYNQLSWSGNKTYFQRWCEGQTGFPIVDAGMRELNTTGYMHNRVRMIVASFLTKDLHIDWRWGERYFAQQLIDYDPAVNNGSWQWAASTGCDAAPYFRIFNPWLQQKKFDPDCVYIKKWIPALRHQDKAAIHQWHDSPSLFDKGDYPKPIVDHRIQKDKALAIFKRVG